MPVTEPRDDTPRWILACLWAVALLSLGFWRHDAWSAVTFAYPLDYGEGPLLDQARRLASLRGIYPPLDAGPPWTVSNYPPVYPAVLAVGTAIFGPTYAWGRAVSLLAALATAWLLGSVLFRRTRDVSAASLAAATFLLAPYVAFWSTLQRVDLLALALSWAAIHRLTASGERSSEGSIVLSAMLLAASILTRQTYALAAPGALFVWLWLRRERGQALRLATWTGGLVLSLTAILQLITGDFLAHVIVANWNPWQLSRLPDFGLDALRLLPVPVMAAVVFVVWTSKLRRPPDESSEPDLRRFVLVYLALSLLGAVAIGKEGSNVNYLLELCAALSLSTGALLAQLRPRRRLVVVASILLSAQWLTWIPPTRHETFTEIYRSAGGEAAAVLRLLKETDSEVVTGQWLGLLPLAGLDIVLPLHERKHLVTHGQWDQIPAVDWLRRGEAERVLLYRPEGLEAWWQGMWTPEMLAALEQSYVVEQRIGSTMVLRPRDR